MPDEPNAKTLRQPKPKTSAHIRIPTEAEMQGPLNTFVKQIYRILIHVRGAKGDDRILYKALLQNYGINMTTRQFDQLYDFVRRAPAPDSATRIRRLLQQQYREEISRRENMIDFNNFFGFPPPTFEALPDILPTDKTLRKRARREHLFRYIMPRAINTQLPLGFFDEE